MNRSRPGAGQLERPRPGVDARQSPRSASAGRLRRFLIVATALVTSLTAGGCSLLPVVLPYFGAATPSPRPAASYSLVAPSPATCLDPSKGVHLVDKSSGFELYMPGNWVRLAPGDDGWVTIYGERNSSTERSVADGSIKDFAVPLKPQEADPTVNMTVYVESNEQGATLQELGDRYEKVMASEGPVLGRASVELGAGPAVWLTSTRPNPYPDGPYVDRVMAYVLAHGGRRYYLDFGSLDANAAQYTDVFACMARSLKFVASV